RMVARPLKSSLRGSADIERRRQAEERLQAESLAESPMLKAALDTYQSESRRADAGPSQDLLATVQHEVNRLAAHGIADAVVGVDEHNRILASAGTRREAWTSGAVNAAWAGDEIIVRPGGNFRI